MTEEKLNPINSSASEPSQSPRKPSQWDNSNGRGKFSVALLLVFILGMGWKFYHQGFHNIGFVASVAIASGLLFIFLLPEKFHRRRRTEAQDVEHAEIRWK